MKALPTTFFDYWHFDNRDKVLIEELEKIECKQILRDWEEAQTVPYQIGIKLEKIAHRLNQSIYVNK